MNLKHAVVAMLLAGLSTISVAQDSATTKISIPGKVTLMGEVSISAVVKAIDASKRIITLKTPDGKIDKITAGPEVRNFDQIKVGDTVKAKAIESLTLELLKGGAGSPERTDATDEARAKKGEKPGAAIASMITFIADVTEVDQKASTITLKGVHETSTLKVNDPEQLKLIKVGDRIKGTYVEAIAVVVETVAAKKK